tara:strand:+ start:108 stop:830 length:723 start_codon:yes stop_codon:yes gene_type:complete
VNLPGLNPFITFSSSHLAVLFISFFLFLFFPYTINKNRNAKWINTFSIALGLLIIGNEIIWVIYKYNLGHRYWPEFMPFELCTIAAYLLGYILIFKPSYAIFEVVYFWSLAGTLQGIFTPRLFAAYPHYLFFEYFITHSGVVLATLILLFRYNWKLTWHSLWKSFIWLQVPALINLVFDFTFDVNYMFMRELPKVPTLMHHFGEWPWYIFISGICGLCLFIILLLPFLINSKTKEFSSLY